jgi:hypothetical protein
LQLRIKDELRAMQLSPKFVMMINEELRRLVEGHRRAQNTIDNYERAAGCSKNQLLKKAGKVHDRCSVELRPT